MSRYFVQNYIKNTELYCLMQMKECNKKYIYLEKICKLKTVKLLKFFC